MKKFMALAIIGLLGVTALAGGAPTPDPRDGTHCEFIRDEVCNSTSAGMVCRPVFREVCLPVVGGGSGGGQPFPGGG